MFELYRGKHMTRRSTVGNWSEVRVYRTPATMKSCGGLLRLGKFPDNRHLTAGPRYIRGCCLMLERRYGFRAGAWVGKALFVKSSGLKTLHDRNTNSSQKYYSYCVVYKNRNKKIFPLLLERKNTRKQGRNACFFTLKTYCAYSNEGKNVKITKTVAIAVTKHPAKFGIKNCREEKLWQFLYHLVQDSISAFRLRPKTHMRSAVICRSLNISVWLRFDCNVQH